VICKADNTPRLTYKRVDGLTTFRSPNAKLLDYVVFYGPQAKRLSCGFPKQDKVYGMIDLLCVACIALAMSLVIGTWRTKQTKQESLQ
jgi:hypothetical protein